MLTQASIKLWRAPPSYRHVRVGVNDTATFDWSHTTTVKVTLHKRECAFFQTPCKELGPASISVWN